MYHPYHPYWPWGIYILQVIHQILSSLLLLFAHLKPFFQKKKYYLRLEDSTLQLYMKGFGEFRIDCRSYKESCYIHLTLKARRYHAYIYNPNRVLATADPIKDSPWSPSGTALSGIQLGESIVVPYQVIQHQPYENHYTRGALHMSTKGYFEVCEA